MTDVPSSAGKRFSEDVRRIREARDVSVDDIHSETQIPRTIIEAFESGELYDHPTYNRVYLRSFLKAYSETIGVPQEAALEGLDAALSGTYEGTLADQYLSEAGTEDDGEDGPDGQGEEQTVSADDAPDDDDVPAESTPDSGGPSGRGGIVGPPRAVGETDDPSIEEVSSPDADVRTPDDEAADDEPEDDEPAAEEASSVEASPTVGADSDSEPPPAAPSDDEAAPESPSAPDADDDATEDTPDVEAAREKLNETTGPEALRSTPDDEEATSDDEETPAWMQEEGEDDETPEAPSSVGEPPDLPSGAGEGTGVVGEPTAMGEGGASAGGGSAPARSAPPGAAGTSNGWLSNSQQIYATGIGLVVVLLVLIGVGIAYINSGEDASDSPSSQQQAPVSDTSTTAASPDTASAAAPPDTTTETAAADSRPPPADVTLGEEIHLMVYATDPITRIEIQRDDDLRRPYWIEANTASVFPFERRIVLQRQLSKAQLYVEGYRYPLAAADTVDGLELTRSTLSAFVDTLRGTPASLSVSPDTIPKGGPPGDTTQTNPTGPDTVGAEDSAPAPSPNR